MGKLCPLPINTASGGLEEDCLALSERPADSQAAALVLDSGRAASPRHQLLARMEQAHSANPAGFTFASLGGFALPRLANNTVLYRLLEVILRTEGQDVCYTFFVQACREPETKNPEVPVNFAEFSKMCSKRSKTMSGKEKSKFDDMAKADKVHYDQEMKDYGPAKGSKEEEPNTPKRPLSGFFLFCSEFHPKIKSINPGISNGDVAKKLGEMWNNLRDTEKQPYNSKAAKLKYEKDVADCKSKGKLDGAKDPNTQQVARKEVEEEDEEDKEDQEEDGGREEKEGDEEEDE
ncbi:LOW QUALITY PROTEIN: high mobility group protein B3-like [Meles meles]|uniref:LOW QUALITY PROTEIN: high mobility group protein B3-like n=1 Tax=Meles meles TaxID=9662 RepID=UPI001E698CF3|nr:LOW QUALITY PROTEIN: high mobility group protein B3-like [Meles meles]